MIEAAEAGDADACTMALRGLRRLPAGQVATIAALALGALEDSDAEAVVEATINHAGMPAPQPLMPMADAKLWASLANRRELKAYAACAFEALSAHDQRAFQRRYFAEVAA